MFDCRGPTDRIYHHKIKNTKYKLCAHDNRRSQNQFHHAMRCDPDCGVRYSQLTNIQPAGTHSAVHNQRPRLIRCVCIRSDPVTICLRPIALARTFDCHQSDQVCGAADTRRPNCYAPLNRNAFTRARAHTGHSSNMHQSGGHRVRVDPWMHRSGSIICARHNAGELGWRT